MGAIKRPVMGYRIGIVGNRNLSGIEISQLEQTLETLLTKLCSGVVDLWKAHNLETDQALYDAEPPRFSLVSSLAEGADQLAVRVAAGMPFDFNLASPIPFPAGDYKRCFHDDESRAEFDRLLALESLSPLLIEMDCCAETREDRQEGYRAAADMLLDHVDLLIAVYDPDRASSRGGSRETQELALHRRLPVIHVNTKNLSEISLQLKVTRSEQQKVDLDDSVIGKILRETLLPTRDDSGRGDEVTGNHMQSITGYASVCRFFDDPLLRKSGIGYWLTQIRCAVYAPVWRLIYRALALFENDPPTLAKCSVPDSEAIKADARVTEFAQRGYAVRQQWELSDKLAIRYMDTYRGSFILNFMLGAVAVLFAVMSYFSGDSTYCCGYIAAANASISAESCDASGLSLWTLAELFCLGMILVTYAANALDSVQRKAISFRYLAEYFRHSEMLGLLGRNIQTSRTAPYHHAHHHPKNTGMGWYINAFMRGLGSFGGLRSANQPGAGSTVQLGKLYVTTVKRTMCMDWLLLQYEYHFRLKGRYLRWKRLSTMAMGLLFLLSLIGVLVHLFHGHLGTIEGWHRDFVLVVFVTALPAFMAAIHGISVQGEFERLAERSSAIADYLIESIDQLDKVSSDNKRFVDSVGDRAVVVARDLLEEVADWQVLYRAHGVELT